MDREFHSRDLFYLRMFGADVDNKALQKVYDKYRHCFDLARMKGELPLGTLLEVAVKYPKSQSKSSSKHKPEKVTA